MQTIYHFVAGNFAILLSAGMSWYSALGFNFLSSLTCFLGFYIGVSVGLESEEANSWMLAATAGTFLYISLVDLVRLIATVYSLKHSHQVHLNIKYITRSSYQICNTPELHLAYCFYLDCRQIIAINSVGLCGHSSTIVVFFFRGGLAESLHQERTKFEGAA